MLARSSEPYLNDLPRVATPPRSLTLDKYPFPGKDSSTGFLQIINVGIKGINDYQGDSEPEDQLPVVKPKQKAYLNLNDSTHLMSNSLREATPPIGKFVLFVCTWEYIKNLGGGGESLTPAEEVVHLRRQLAKLNRRVMALELENVNRLQKEKILAGFGIAYFLLKVIIWMNRD